MFGLNSLSSFTGGGDLMDSGGASADGDNTFGGNAFDYRNDSDSGSNTTIVVVGLLSFVAGVFVAKAVK